ncbi:MAG: hypothetical protein ACJ8F7_05175 [Gemmataceae bacterium]
MPIKFRCVYCEQLLGIARRKAGTVVKCPNCAGQLIVPAPDALNTAEGGEEKDDATAAAPELEVAAAHNKSAATIKPADPGATEGGLLFERNDFDELLRPMQGKKPSSGGSSRGSAPRPVPQPQPYEAPAVPAAIAPKIPTRKGILLTPLRLALLLVFMILGFALSFAGGLIAGRLMWK